MEAALEETDIVVVPVGSVEQHGRHLPLGSDTIQGDDIARRLVAKLGAEGVRVVAAPSIPFGVSEAHMRFPGTIALSSGTARVSRPEGYMPRSVLANGGN